jgi:hypothetical protein
MGNPQANSQKRISNYPSAAFSSATRDMLKADALKADAT